jgi:FliZ protein
MTVQQSKRRPLSRYLKDFKHSQTHCAHCNKLLDRITLVRRAKSSIRLRFRVSTR